MSITVDRRAFLGSTATLIGSQFISGLSQASTATGNNRAQNLEPPILQISNVIKRDLPSEYQAYLEVQTNTEGKFTIGLYKDTHTQKISRAIYNERDKTQGKLFPTPSDQSKPVAIVDARGADLEGTFKIYDSGNNYSSSYPTSPTLWLPNHTEVATNYLFSMNNSLNRLPEGIVDAFRRNETWTMLGKNVEDTYYWLFPSWRTHDQNTPIDPNKPWIEKINGRWVDNRRYANLPGLFLPSMKRIVIPQTYITYGTRDGIEDRNGRDEWNRDTVFHEAGHGTDYLNSYSDADGFVSAYERDKRNIPESEEHLVSYFLQNRSEPFAEITGALMGGLSGRRSARILSYFYNAAEHIRTQVLPAYSYRITPEYIRQNIYPGYGSDRRVATALYPEIQLASSLTEDAGQCAHLHENRNHILV